CFTLIAFTPIKAVKAIILLLSGCILHCAYSYEIFVHMVQGCIHFVNSLVPCDLCDHSQISHVVSNDVRSDILLTTIHVITDWPISDHMIGTSHRGPVQ
ncbi:unnamed protein product, partial [Staurois parvus]